MVASAGLYFGFSQFEFGCALGPTPGRYVLRQKQDTPERVCVLAGAMAPRAGRFVRRFRRARDAGAKPVAITRAIIAHTPGFSSADEASDWLDGLRKDKDAAEQTIKEDVRALNGLVRAHRAAAGDPYSPEIAADRALVVRIGFATGDEVADCRFTTAYEVTVGHRSRSRTQGLGAQQQLAALLAGRAQALACEEFALRARADLEAGSLTAAALQTQLTLETALFELSSLLDDEVMGLLAAHRDPIGIAASAARGQGVSPDNARAVADGLAAIERALRQLGRTRS